MTEKTVYVAFDDKEFEDYSECERYESKELQVYNEEGELLSLDNGYCLYQESAYVVCKSEEALNYINKTFYDNNANGIDYEGNFPVSFYYDFDTDEWKKLNIVLKNCKTKLIC